MLVDVSSYCESHTTIVMAIGVMYSYCEVTLLAQWLNLIFA